MAAVTIGRRMITISNFSMLVDFHLFGGLTNGAMGCLNQKTMWNGAGGVGTEALTPRKKRKRCCHFDGILRVEAELFRQWPLHNLTHTHTYIQCIDNQCPLILNVSVLGVSERDVQH